MSQTLGEATYRVARALGIVTEGVATGGSTSTLIDTRVLTQAVDYWNGGTVWVLRDSAEGGAAPEGEFARVTAFSGGTDTATLGPVSAGSGTALTASIASGDRYAIGKRRYPIHQIIQKVNEELVNMGSVAVTDTTTLDTTAAQTEYTLPLAAGKDLREVWIQGKVGDTNDNRWVLARNWYIQRTSAGTQDVLVVPAQYVTSRDIKLVYADEHPMLDDASDAISDMVHMDRLVYGATTKLLMWRKQKVGSGDPTLNEQLAYYIAKDQEAKQKYPIRVPRRTPKLMIIDHLEGVNPDNFRVPPHT